MKQILFIISLIFFSTFSFGQSKSELEIRQLENYWAELLDKSDTTALSKVWSKDYIVNNPAGKIITGNDIIGFIRNGQKFPAYQRIIESVTFSKNLAIVMGKEISQPQKDALGIEQKIVRRFTNIWVKEKKEWKLVARQATNIANS
ncbi:MAG: nuclear transport factor 2 family protein [Cytophagaceae bacterium]|nr:nuclear transport factor 2 family protein [Cytophagaceae bacterium]